METGLDVFADADEDDEVPLITSSTNTSPQNRDASLLVSTFNLANCAVGAGVLSVPYAVSELGAVLALVALPAVAAVVIFTLHVLIKAGDVYGAVSYQELVSKALGPLAAHFVSFTLILYIAGSCVAYTIIVADAFASVYGALGMSGAVAPGVFGFERTTVIITTNLCILLPLSLLRRTKHLAPTSTVTIIALLYTALAVVKEFFSDLVFDDGGIEHCLDGGGNYTGNSSSTWSNSSNVFHDNSGTLNTTSTHHNKVSFHATDNYSVGSVTFANRSIDLWRFDKNATLALPIFVFAFQCHIQILSIYAELRDEKEEVEVGDNVGETDDEEVTVDASDNEATNALFRFQKSQSRKRQRSMFRVATAATTVCLLGYLLVGLCCYLNHPSVDSNMLKSYDTKDPYMLIATVGMALSAVGSFPMNQFSARAALDDLLAAGFGWTPAAPGLAPIERHVSQTLMFLLATTLTALQIEDLGKVFQLVGSTAGVLVICWVPAALLIIPKPRDNVRHGDDNNDRDEHVFGTDYNPSSTSRTYQEGDETQHRGHSRRGRTRGEHWTDGGGSIGNLHDLVGSGFGGGGDADLAPSGMADSASSTQALLGAETNGTDHLSASTTDLEKKQRPVDCWRGVGLVLLGLVIAVSNVYVLFFNKVDEDVTGEDPTGPTTNQTWT